MATIQSLLNQGGYIVTDGAMGTVLFASGLDHGDPPELWNINFPNRVAAVHNAYIEAGAQILLTNTFGGNHHRLALHNAQDQVEEANHAAAVILRKVVDQSGLDLVVAGERGHRTDQSD